MRTELERFGGLGLAIVAELVAAHAGRITLDTSPGAGTMFAITLPTANDETTLEPQPPRVDVVIPLAGRAGGERT